MLFCRELNPIFFQLLYMSPMIQSEGQDLYSFTYEGDIFEQFGTLAIRIAAFDNYEDYGLLNGSAYFVQHNPIRNQTFEEISYL